MTSSFDQTLTHSQKFPPSSWPGEHQNVCPCGGAQASRREQEGAEHAHLQWQTHLQQRCSDIGPQGDFIIRAALCREHIVHSYRVLGEPTPQKEKYSCHVFPLFRACRMTF